jgi:hypothetical protein
LYRIAGTDSSASIMSLRLVSGPVDVPGVDTSSSSSPDDVKVAKFSRPSTSTKPFSQTSQTSQTSTTSRRRTPRSTKTAAPTNRVSRSKTRLLGTPIVAEPDYYVLRILSDVGASTNVLDTLASDSTLVSLSNLLLNNRVAPRSILRLLSHPSALEQARFLHSSSAPKTFDDGLRECVNRANEGHEQLWYWNDPLAPHYHGDIDDIEDPLPDTPKSVGVTKQETDFVDADAFPTPVKQKSGATTRRDEGKQEETPSGVSVTQQAVRPPSVSPFSNMSEKPQPHPDSTSPNANSPKSQTMAMEEAPTVGKETRPPQDLRSHSFSASLAWAQFPGGSRQDASQDIHAMAAAHHVPSEHIDAQGGRRVGEDEDSAHLNAHGGQREDEGSHLPYSGEDGDQLHKGDENLEESDAGGSNVEQDDSEGEGSGPLAELPKLYEHDADRSRDENLRGMETCMWDYMDYMAQRCRVSLDTVVDRVFATRVSNGRSSNAWNTYLAMRREDPDEHARLTALGIPLKGERLSFSWQRNH